MDINKTLKDRGDKYGPFSGHANITQDIKSVLQNSFNWPILTDSMKEALEMTAHKMGRILNGDPSYDDNWIDIIGYITLVVNELHNERNERNERKDPF